MRNLVLVALLGAVLVAVGVGMWTAPAGLVVGGCELMVGAYVGAYARKKGGWR